MPLNNDILIPGIEAWQAATLVNGWVNTTSNYSPAGFYKDPFERVYVRGVIANGTNSLIFTLPVGYRPLLFRILFNTVSASGLARVDVYTNGQIHLVGGANTGLTLDGLSFRI